MTTTTDAAANWKAHVLSPDGDRSRDSGARSSKCQRTTGSREGRAHLPVRRFAGSPVRRFAGSPVRRFAGSRSIRYTYASVDL